MALVPTMRSAPALFPSIWASGMTTGKNRFSFTSYPLTTPPSTMMGRRRHMLSVPRRNEGRVRGLAFLLSGGLHCLIIGRVFASSKARTAGDRRADHGEDLLYQRPPKEKCRGVSRREPPDRRLAVRLTELLRKLTRQEEVVPGIEHQQAARLAPSGVRGGISRGPKGGGP